MFVALFIFVVYFGLLTTLLLFLYGDAPSARLYGYWLQCGTLFHLGRRTEGCLYGYSSEETCQWRVSTCGPLSIIRVLHVGRRRSRRFRRSWLNL